ncbi:unnamed protein product [Lymnaea stagnalis]|uniref:C-type lectin domain-containing protein n=1 Tax=Lymnaea stagnalis TaxID=6523 RepID=A0AAV2H9C2_LYMST
MGRKLVHFILVLTFASVPAVRSECRWPGSVLSEGSCFLYNETTSSYSDANAVCRSNGGVLAKVKTKTQLLESTVEAKNNANFWIGARYDDVKGKWVWEDDNSVATELSLFWAPNQRDAGCAQIYVRSATDKILYSYTCSEPRRFLCMEKDVITTQDTTLMTSTQTSLVTSTDPTTSSTPLTAITVNMTTNTTANPILSSTPDTKMFLTTLMKCSANFSELNIPMLLSLCVFKYLIC